MRPGSDTVHHRSKKMRHRVTKMHGDIQAGGLAPLHTKYIPCACAFALALTRTLVLINVLAPVTCAVARDSRDAFVVTSRSAPQFDRTCALSAHKAPKRTKMTLRQRTGAT